MNQGWIKIYRSIMETSFYRDSQAVHLAIHLMLKANHKPKSFMFNHCLIYLQTGQCITGRHELSKQLGISASTIRRKLIVLQSVRFLDIKRTNKYSIITITKYEQYQTGGNDVDNEMDIKRTSNGHQTDTNNNDKNEKNDIGTKAKELLDYFFNEHLKKRKLKYLVHGAKDIQLLKTLLKDLTVDNIKDMINRFLDSTDPFISKAGYTIGVFYSQRNKLQENEINPYRELK
jgi:hypothetical protein